MARIRTIKPDFFRHERLFEAEQATGLPLRIAFAGLWTAADREGRFRWSPRALKLDCLPYDDVDFSRVLHALVTCGFIVQYEADGVEYGAIPSWSSHQVINNREAASEIPEPNETNVLTRAPRVDDAKATPLVQVQGEGKGKEGKGKDIPTVADATRRDEHFEEFWKAYPRREGANPKDPAAKLFHAAVKSGEDPERIIAGAKRCASVEAKNIGTPYIPQAVKWLRDKRWKDYLAEAEQATQALNTMFYAKAESEQLAAWDQHSRSLRGKGLPRDRNGGWYVPTEWPPGHEPRASSAVLPVISMQSMQH